MARQVHRPAHGANCFWESASAISAIQVTDGWRTGVCRGSRGCVEGVEWERHRPDEPGSPGPGDAARLQTWSCPPLSRDTAGEVCALRTAVLMRTDGRPPHPPPSLPSPSSELPQIPPRIHTPRRPHQREREVSMPNDGGLHRARPGRWERDVGTRRYRNPARGLNNLSISCNGS